MKYVRILDQLDAKLIKLVLSDGRITEEVHLHQDGTAEKHYVDFLDATGSAQFDETPFDAILAWANGGGNESRLRVVPEQFAAQIKALNGMLPTEMHLALDETLIQNLLAMIENMVSERRSIDDTRGLLGADKGGFGNISGKDELLQIWSKIRKCCPEEISRDQLFGFVAPECRGGQAVPMPIGIIGCCASLDFIGFQAEPKSRKIEKLPNVRSDAIHIAMGAYCHIIVTGDQRLARRARAIYQYKSIATVPFRAYRTQTGEIRIDPL
jgi:hypothetical protein